MDTKWKRWCRLCASADHNNSHINMFLIKAELGPIVDVINKCFSVNMNQNEDWPSTICTNCHQFVNVTIEFREKTLQVQAMFAELLHSRNELDAGQLKIQYNIRDDAEEELKHCSDVGPSHFEPKANVTPIKEEDLAEINDDEEEHSDQPLSTERIESSDEYNTSEASSDGEFIEEPKRKRGRPRNGESTQNKVEKAKETFTCDECQVEFAQCKRYRIHMQSEHGIKLEFSCTECSKSYSTAKRLENHKNAHLLSVELSCTECSKSFSTMKSLESHKRRHLPQEEKFTVPCKICNKKFTNAGVVQQHIRSVHMDEKPFICDECGKTYKSFGSLKEHKQSHNEDRPFHCKFCEKRFKTKTRLKIHTDTHNETTYICPVCGLQLNTRRTLNTHMVVHSDQKRYKCDFCGNDFKRAKALKNHLILHTGLKPYKCIFCDKSFAAGSSCRAHKRTAHPKELAAMEEAGEQCRATNVPNLEQLRSITSNKSLCVS